MHMNKLFQNDEEIGAATLSLDQLLECAREHRAIPLNCAAGLAGKLIVHSATLEGDHHCHD